MSTSNILSHYIEAEFVRGSAHLQSDDDLLTTGIINSLGILKLVSFIEQRFGVQVPDEDIVFENFQTIEKLSNYLDTQR